MPFRGSSRIHLHGRLSRLARLRRWFRDLRGEDSSGTPRMPEKPLRERRRGEDLDQLWTRGEIIGAILLLIGVLYLLWWLLFFAPSLF